MRSLQVGAAIGALCLLGACVSDHSSVDGSKRLAQLSGEEVVYLCDWAVDFMGGPAAQHSCPRDFETEADTQVTTWDETECHDFVYQLWELEICNQLSVSQFESHVRDVADDPCRNIETQYDVPGGFCVLSHTVGN